MKGKNSRENGTSYAVGIATGVFTCLAVSLLLTAIAAWMVSSDTIGGSNIIVLMIQILSSIVGAWLAHSLIKKTRLVVCLSTSALYGVALLSVNALFFNGQYNNLLVSLLAVLAGGVLEGMLGLVGNRNFHSRKIKIANR